MNAPLYLREDDVRKGLSMTEALDAVEHAFRELAGDESLRIPGISAPDSSPLNAPRTRLSHPRGLLHVMAASLPERGYLGLKSYTTLRGTSPRFVVLLFSGADGKLLAVIEADLLGKIRTGAASGVATKLLARDDAAVFAVFGTGGQALTQVQAVLAVRPVREVRVVGRNADRRDRFVKTLSNLYSDLSVRAFDPKSAVEGADIVTTITSAKEPLFDGAWLRPGTHVNAAGSNICTRREIDAAAVRSAAWVVVDSLPQAMRESGDLVMAAQEGAWSWDRAIELAHALSGKRPIRRAPDDITLFESQGIAVEDVAVAAVVYERALALGLGRPMGDSAPDA